MAVVRRGSGCLASFVLGLSLFSAVASASQVTDQEYGAFRQDGGLQSFDIDFVIDRMMKGEPISRRSVEAFQTLSEGGPSRYGSALDQDDVRQVAGLLDRYGERVVAGQLRERWGVATASGRGYGEVESDIGTLERPTGSDTVREGNQMVIQDPPGGRSIRNIGQSCFYRSSIPQPSAEPVGRYVQNITLPSPQTWQRIVEILPKGDIDIDNYRIQNIVINAREGESTASRFRAYVFGQKISQVRHVERVDMDGMSYTDRQEDPVREPPQWMAYSCHPQFIRP